MKVKAECGECGYQHSIEQDEEMMIFHIALYRCFICGSTEITRNTADSEKISALEKLKLTINGKKNDNNKKA